MIIYKIFRADEFAAFTDAGETAAEPIAWATIALARSASDTASRGVSKRTADAAAAGADWLAERQQRDGSVGVTQRQHRPAWTTAPAVLAWLAVDPTAYAAHIVRALWWAVSQKPWTAPKTRTFGHDTSLEGWSWAADTHSWLDPSAYFVRALHVAGWADHPRAVEGVRLLVDRLLPSGGANYGNTIVLGQELLQHVQSSGVVAWALHGTSGETALSPTIRYLQEALAEPTGLASLGWAALGLASHGAADERLAERVIAAADRAAAAEGVYKPALYAAACQALLAPLPATNGENP